VQQVQVQQVLVQQGLVLVQQGLVLVQQGHPQHARNLAQQLLSEVKMKLHPLQSASQNCTNFPQ
jgi:uncharacterized protein YjeT (DUF2065 family)